MHTHEVELQLADGRPIALQDAGILYTVTDTPTELDELFNGPTHVPFVDGWRFQGTSAAGDTFVFDVVRRQETWILVHLYA